MDALFLGGRILFALVFVLSGLTAHLLQARQTVDYARQLGAPAPQLTVPLTGVVIVAAGIMVALGVWTDLALLVLALFLVGSAVVMHAFWRESDPQVSQNQLSHFLKNVSLAGAALALVFAVNQLQDGAALSLTAPLFDRA